MDPKAAIDYLARKPRFEAELRAWLGEDHADLIPKLKPYLNDALTLDTYLRAHDGRSSIGRARMVDELSERGCPSQLIESALENLLPEAERARELLAAHRRDLSPRSARFLLSRGFDEETVRELIEADPE
jgi:SOS response regulatory protein OraA/RecX